MAYNRSYDTDDGAIPAALRRFIRHRLFEISGVALLASLAAVGVALATWSVDDPSFNHATDQIAKNYLGYPGAAIADELMQLLGLGVLPLIGIPMAWVVNLLSHERPERPFMAMLAWLAATFLACGAFATLPAPSSWSLAAGLGGNSGDIISGGMLSILALGLKGAFAEVFTGALCAGTAIWAALRATGLTKSETTGTLGTLGPCCRCFLDSTPAFPAGQFHALAGLQGPGKIRPGASCGVSKFFPRYYLKIGARKKTAHRTLPGPKQQRTGTPPRLAGIGSGTGGR